MTSTLVFDIIQFFPSLNHWLLLLILEKTGCHTKVIQFFSNYLVGRKMWLSQMSYSLVVILELSGISEVQYKEIMIIGDE